MPYIYRVSRREPQRIEPAEVVAEPEVSYRDLQAHAKELGIPANQTADDLRKAIEEAESDG